MKEDGRMKNFNDTNGVALDPNNWSHVEWWYEDEPEIYEFIMENEELVKGFAKFENMSIREAIDILYNRIDGEYV